MKTHHARLTRAGLALALAAATVPLTAYGEDTAIPAGTSSPRAGQLLPTISISGSTAMRNFTISESFTAVDRNSSVTLGAGTIAQPAVTYTLGNTGGSRLIFALSNTSIADNSGANGTAQGARIEWHEQGSVEGILELADSQINDIYNNNLYNPTTGNGTFVNRNRWGGTTGGNNTGFTGASTTEFQGFRLAPQASGTNFGGFGVSNATGQNRVQLAISDVNATQGFSISGAAGSRNLTPGQAGYGKGNAFLGTAGALVSDAGVPNPGSIANSGRQLRDASVLNMVAGTIDPSTGATYGVGAFNTAGTGNLRNEKIAVTATTFAANPGTGLTRLNRSDAQWLQTTGRLGNGADFNVATRDVNSGTLNVASLNAGLDPSFTTGENDAGNGLTADGGTDQVIVGGKITFSNKTAGGGQLRPVVQRSRMAVGHLSLSDAIGSATVGNAAPVRILNYRDDVDDVANGNNGTGRFDYNAATDTVSKNAADPDAGTFVKPSLETITNGQYVIYQNQTYVTVIDPTVGGTAVKGDNAGGDVRDLINNIKGSAFTGTPGTVATAGTPAEGLAAERFILPKYMLVTKDVDGLGTSTVNTGVDAGRASFVANNSSRFAFGDAAAIKAGTGGTYGANIAAYSDPANTATNRAPLGGSIAITDTNYLFGDFDQTGGEFDAAANAAGKKGIRDFSDMAAAQKYQAELAATGATGWDTAADLNSRAVTPGGLPTRSKGDLIVMGDYDSDGDFDGKDLYRFARGATLADNATSTTLTTASGSTFGDMARNGVLRKNAALDQLAANATPQQKIDASANLANDPTGANAFDKLDVNRDGLVNRNDAAVVNSMVGRDYRNLDNQLAAVVKADGTAFTSDPLADVVTPRRLISLVDVELNDTGDITQRAVGGVPSDMRIIADTLVTAGKLKRGDVNFSGSVTNADVTAAFNNFGGTDGSKKWSQGDVSGYNGNVTNSDITAIFNDFGTSAPLRPGNNVADVVYNAVTGQILIDPDGGKIISFSLLNGGTGFINLNTVAFPDASTFTTKLPDEIGWTDINGLAGTGFSNLFALGFVLPAGLTEAQLQTLLDGSAFSRGGGNGGAFEFTVVPEPTGLGLLALGGLTLLRRRRA